MLQQTPVRQSNLLLLLVFASFYLSCYALAPTRALHAASSLSLTSSSNNNNSNNSSSSSSSSSSSDSDSGSNSRTLLIDEGYQRDAGATRSSLAIGTKTRNDTTATTDGPHTPRRIALVDDYVTYRSIPCIILMGIPMLLVLRWAEEVRASKDSKPTGQPTLAPPTSSDASAEQLLSQQNRLTSGKLPPEQHQSANGPSMTSGNLEKSKLPGTFGASGKPGTCGLAGHEQSEYTLRQQHKEEQEQQQDDRNSQPQLPEPATKPSQATGRLAVIDNTKFLMVFIVILEHTEMYVFKTPGCQRIIYCTDPFVTRCLAFASGLVSKDQMSKKFLETVFFRLFLPWFFYQTIFICLLWSPLAHEDMSLTFERAWINLKYSPNPGWYLLGLAEWRLISAFFNWLKLTRVQQLVISLILAAFSSYGGEATGLYFLDWDLTSWNLQTLPGYIFAQSLPLKEAFERVPSRSQNRYLGAILFFTVIFMQTVNFPLPNHEIPAMKLFTENHGIPANEDFSYYFVWLRSTYRVFLEAAKSLLFIFCVCPRSEGWMSHYGQYTIYPYIVHRLLIPVYYYTLYKVQWPIASDSNSFLAGTIQYFLLTLALLTIEIGLSTAPVRYVFSPIVEPVWAQRLYHAAIGRK